METQQKQMITKDMKVGEIMDIVAGSGDIMASYGLHCVGCHVNVFETLEQGTMGHGMEESTLENMVRDLNEAYQKQLAQQEHKHSEPIHIEGNEISLTEAAAEKIKSLLAQQNKQGHGLKFSVSPGGCAGHTYGLDFAEKAVSEDTTIVSHGVKIFVPKKNLAMLAGTQIDYVDGLQGAGFKIENPNAHSSCGCGKSFS